MIDNSFFGEWVHALVSASPTVALSLGIALTIFGSCFMSVGSVVMKTGIHQESERLQEDISVPLSSRVWWLGLLTYSFGAFLHILGLAFAPASVLAPLNSLGLVANAVAAVVFLNEVLSWVEVLCTVGAIIGVTLCAVSSFLPHDESFVVDGVDSWTDPPYLVYVAACGAGLLSLLILVNRGEARVAEEQWEASFKRHIEMGHIELAELAAMTEEEPEDHRMGLLKGLYPKTTEQSSAMPTGSTVQSLYPGYVGVLYGIVAGIVGAQCVLQLKEFSAFLKVSVDEGSVWFGAQPYLAALFGGASIVLQMHFLNLGLARGDATLVIPTYYVSWTVLGTIGGFVKFHEVLGFTGTQIGLFLIGLILTLVCVALMASGEVERVQIDVEKTTRPGIPDKVMEAPLTLGVPLAVGLGVVPMGRLAGRFRTLPHSAQPGLRRIRSLSSLADVIKHPAAPYPWTVTEGFRLIPTEEEDAEPHVRLAQSPQERVCAVPQPRQKRKYKSVDDIVFEDSAEHASTPPYNSNFLASYHGQQSNATAGVC